MGLLQSNTAFNGANSPAIVVNSGSSHSSNYLQGILNSRLATYHFRGVCPAKLGGYYRFNANNINSFPIRAINFTDPNDVTRHDQMVALVERMLALHRQRQAARTPQEQNVIGAQIEATDRQIDRLVYALYGLTAEELGRVEGE